MRVGWCETEQVGSEDQAVFIGMESGVRDRWRNVAT